MCFNNDPGYLLLDGTSFLKEISKHYQVVYYYYYGDTCLKFGKVDSIRWFKHTIRHHNSLSFIFYSTGSSLQPQNVARFPRVLKHI